MLPIEPLLPTMRGKAMPESNSEAKEILLEDDAVDEFHSVFEERPDKGIGEASEIVEISSEASLQVAFGSIKMIQDQIGAPDVVAKKAVPRFETSEFPSAPLAFYAPLKEEAGVQSQTDVGSVRADDPKDTNKFQIIEAKVSTAEGRALRQSDMQIRIADRELAVQQAIATSGKMSLVSPEGIVDQGVRSRIGEAELAKADHVAAFGDVPRSSKSLEKAAVVVPQEIPKRVSGTPTTERTQPIGQATHSVIPVEDVVPSRTEHSINHSAAPSVPQVSPGISVSPSSAKITEHEIFRQIAVVDDSSRGQGMPTSDMGLKDFGAAFGLDQTTRNLIPTTAVQAAALHNVQGNLVTQQVAMQISLQVGSARSKEIELRLEPEELGKLRITILTRETGLTVSVVAERPETLELLKRNSDQLMADLGDRNLGGANLEFFSGERDEQPAEQGRPVPDTAEPQATTVKITTAEGLTGRLDMRL